MGDRNFSKKIYCNIVIYNAFFNKSAMSVICILTKTDICNYHKFGHFIFNLFNGLLNNSVLIVCRSSKSIFFIRNTKKHDCRYSKIFCFFCLFYCIIYRKLKVTRH
eukprot:gnl/Chilomastix_cuspidata/14168.p2 GENE.gnl/Chilomastix_cuspidata/14168~~gnl/Chilomastix_cuspidata/14168.p2  ORF type:complete len:106 (+),score=0.15 gnl/Chilomastix_cuspidata/14168:239-556(+)